MRTLRIGSRGADVQRWQAFLSEHGYVPGRVDGIFDTGTFSATRKFQSDQRLSADGVVGPKTLAAAGGLGLRVLRRVLNAELTSALTTEARRLLAKHHADPFGTEEAFEIGGVRYVGRLEEHYHPPGGPLKPWGPHPGISLFVETRPDAGVVAPDDVVDPPGPPGLDDEHPAVVAHEGVVVIDPGHGGTVRIGGSSPNNARSPSGVLEKELTLEIAHLVRSALADRAPRLRVELTRTTDTNLGLADRARVAKTAKADLFLSIHFNGFDGVARGVEALVRPKSGGNLNYGEDHAFAERVQRNVHSALLAFDPTTPSRGVKDQDLGVLRDEFLGNSSASHPCRACLLEVEFMDVPKVDELFNTGPRIDEVRRSVATAIAEAILAELGVAAAEDPMALNVA